MLSADVVVIGGGPAGAAAARLLAQWDRSVVAIGRAPSRRSLAESLPPSCTKLLDALGVRAAIDAAGFVRASGNTVQWGTGGGQRRSESFLGGSGYQVDRVRLDALLNDAAQAAGALVVRGATVRAVKRGDDGWTVEYDSDTGPPTCRAQWVPRLQRTRRRRRARRLSTQRTSRTDDRRRRCLGERGVGERGVCDAHARREPR
jgi:flavin-dependent dehydrogenase